MHRMRGQRDKHLFIHISMHQTKVTLAGLLLAVGEQKSFIKAGNDLDYNVPTAFTTNKTAQGA